MKKGVSTTDSGGSSKQFADAHPPFHLDAHALPSLTSRSSPSSLRSSSTSSSDTFRSSGCSASSASSQCGRRKGCRLRLGELGRQQGGEVIRKGDRDGGERIL